MLLIKRGKELLLGDCPIGREGVLVFKRKLMGRMLGVLLLEKGIRCELGKRTS